MSRGPRSVILKGEPLRAVGARSGLAEGSRSESLHPSRERLLADPRAAEWRRLDCQSRSGEDGSPEQLGGGNALQLGEFAQLLQLFGQEAHADLVAPATDVSASPAPRIAWLCDGLAVALAHAVSMPLRRCARYPRHAGGARLPAPRQRGWDSGCARLTAQDVVAADQGVGGSHGTGEGSAPLQGG